MIWIDVINAVAKRQGIHTLSTWLALDMKQPAKDLKIIDSDVMRLAEQIETKVNGLQIKLEIERLEHQNKYIKEKVINDELQFEIAVLKKYIENQDKLKDIPESK